MTGHTATDLEIAAARVTRLERQLASARAERDRLITVLRLEEQRSLGYIAGAAGMSKTGVVDVLARTEKGATR